MTSIARVELRNYTTAHKCSIYDFPQRGIVLVTGANGSGKSSIIEGVSMALWGRSLRGKPGWLDDAPGELIVSTHDGLVVRRQRKRKTVVAFTYNGEEEKFDTATKADARLAQIVGDFLVWRRSHAFSSRDSANFTEAADADRKRFLETILGATRMDEALRKCRRDRALIEERVARAHSAHAAAVASMEAYDASLKTASEDSVDVPPARYSVDDLDHAKARVKRLRQQHALAIETERTAAGECERAEGALQAVRKRDAKLGALGETCERCEQKIDAKHVESNHKRAIKEIAELEARIARLREAEAKARSDSETIASQLNDAQVRMRTIESDIADHTRAVTLASAYKVKIEKARKALLDAHDTIDDREEELRAAQKDLAFIEKVEFVLSTRGVRAHLLNESLAFIEATANTWLSKIVKAGVELKLSPCTEDGRDLITLDVSNVGGGHGYMATSGGERRRIDIALMLAMGEVVEASSGSSGPRTMFFDEVFDALDADGVSAVCDVMKEIAQEHCVVVISHNDHVLRDLRRAASLSIRL